jgi:hypothetical protein
MTVGSRIVFMRFATARSPKLQLWIDHFERVVGHGPRVVNSVVSSQDECIVEHGNTEVMFGSPTDSRTFDYVNGRFG